jgi:precorrin-2 dehydrogenase/sirohydrochlorin ferrochelatase
MLINLNVHDREVFVAGGGSVGERMALKFFGEGCRVVVGSMNFTESLKRTAQDGKGKLKLVQLDANKDGVLLQNLVSNARIIVAATNECALNKDILAKARSKGALVCVVDNPSESDFSPVAITNVGDIQIAVYTAGKSPAMARMLRERVAKTITPVDVRRVELLYFARKLAKTRVLHSKTREDLMHKIIQDKKIDELLQNGSIEEAKSLVEKAIKEC